MESMTVHVTLSTSCESGVIDLGTYSDDEAVLACNQLRKEAVDGFGNCTVEEYHDDELVEMREYTADGCITMRASGVPGTGGLAVFKE